MSADLVNIEKSLLSGYSYSFNGMEKDDEVYGAGNSYDFGARIYNPRLGRWMSPDPQFVKQTSWSPYKAMYDNPIVFVDPDGEIEIVTYAVYDERGVLLYTTHAVVSGNLMTDGTFTVEHTVTGTTDKSVTNWYHYEKIIDVTIKDDGTILYSEPRVKMMKDVVIESEEGGSYANEDIKIIPAVPEPFKDLFGIVFYGQPGSNGQTEKSTATYYTSLDYKLIEAMSRRTKGLTIKGVQVQVRYFKINYKTINKESFKLFNKVMKGFYKEGNKVAKPVPVKEIDDRYRHFEYTDPETDKKFEYRYDKRYGSWKVRPEGYNDWGTGTDTDSSKVPTEVTEENKKLQAEEDEQKLKDSGGSPSEP